MRLVFGVMALFLIAYGGIILASPPEHRPPYILYSGSSAMEDSDTLESVIPNSYCEDMKHSACWCCLPGDGDGLACRATIYRDGFMVCWHPERTEIATKKFLERLSP